MPSSSDYPKLVQERSKVTAKRQPGHKQTMSCRLVIPPIVKYMAAVSSLSAGQYWGHSLDDLEWTKSRSRC